MVQMQKGLWSFLCMSLVAWRPNLCKIYAECCILASSFLSAGTGQHAVWCQGPAGIHCQIHCIYPDVPAGKQVWCRTCRLAGHVALITLPEPIITFSIVYLSLALYQVHSGNMYSLCKVHFISPCRDLDQIKVVYIHVRSMVSDGVLQSAGEQGEPSLHHNLQGLVSTAPRLITLVGNWSKWKEIAGPRVGYQV